MDFINKTHLPEDEDPVLAANTATLEHNEIAVHFTIVRETTHGCNGFLCQIVISSTTVLYELSTLSLDTRSNTVYLPVNLSPVMVTLLTSTGDGELDPARMPRTDTGYLTETLMSLTWQLLCVPTRRNTLTSVTLGSTDNVDHLALCEHISDRNTFLEVLHGPVYLVADATSIYLDFQNVGLLLALVENLLL